MKKKCGFTLVEMLIVMCIVVILMGVTMKFGASRVQELQLQTIREDFTLAYQQFSSRILNTNYYGDQRYTGVFLDFSSGSHRVIAGYSVLDSGVLLFDSSRAVFDSLKVDTVPVQRVFIQYIPYQLGCSLVGKEFATGSVFSFRMRIGDRNQYCFLLSSDLCKLREIACSAL